MRVTMATAAASLVAVAGAAPPAAASAACPWVGSSAPIAQRVSQLLSHMSTTQKVSLLTGASGSSYVLDLTGSNPGCNAAGGPLSFTVGSANATAIPDATVPSVSDGVRADLSVADSFDWRLPHQLPEGVVGLSAP